MKRRFLPLSLLLVIMILGQSIAIADNGGHYVPRPQTSSSAEAYLSDLRVNQHTGLIDPACMIKAAQAANTKDEADLYWLSMGPDNMGGQTTAVVYDNRLNENGNPNGVMYIGSKGGGVYKSYNHGITWHQVGGINLMVSCMAQDKNGVIYVGTGDCGSAATYNGLDQQSYTNSFVGSGLYKIVNDEISQIASTKPSANEAGAWSFINAIAINGNNLFVATEAGLKFSENGGESWNLLIEGSADEVTCTADGKVVASVDGMVYVGTIEEMVCHSAESIAYDDNHNIITLPTATGLVDVAIAASNNATIYASLIDDKGVCQGIYVSKNFGNTWAVVMPVSNGNYGHDIYGSYGLNNHCIVVDPANEDILYLCGYNLWKLIAPANGTGYYFTQQLTNGGATTISEDTYLHVGLNTMVFNPNNANEIMVGTDGGIFRGARTSNGFNFFNCNRNYITTRMFGVAYSGNTTRIMGGGLDHGTVMIEGLDDLNTPTNGVWVNPTGDLYGMYSETSQAGQCAFSMINPNTIFVTYKGGNIARSETAGEDWVSTNFLENLGVDFSTISSFRLPFMLYESFNDAQNPDSVKYINESEENLPAGAMVQVMSNKNYPFWCELESALAAGDSIMVQDPIGARMFLALNDNSSKYGLYMTYGALNFSAAPKWYQVSGKKAGFDGQPLCMAYSSDCDNVFVGFKEGKLVRVSGINSIDDAIAYDDSLAYQHTTIINLPIDGQCVTSVAVDPRNANNVVVTLGNYGNEAYVLYSNNALADEPTFTSMQGNLPKMPVYSSAIEMETGKVILGTEHGVYMANAIGSANWTSAGHAMGDVPVMELKQQVMDKAIDSVVTITEEIIPLDSIHDSIVIHRNVEFFPGTNNAGIIYAATYGRGLFRCENFKKHSATGIEENEVVAEKQLNIYPNPVRDQAHVNFEGDGQVVSYQVYDMMGRLVMSQTLGRVAEGSQQLQLNVSDLSTGAYILRLNQGVNSSVAKFLVY